MTTAISRPHVTDAPHVAHAVTGTAAVTGRVVAAGVDTVKRVADGARVLEEAC